MADITKFFKPEKLQAATSRFVSVDDSKNDNKCENCPTPNKKSKKCAPSNKTVCKWEREWKKIWTMTMSLK